MAQQLARILGETCRSIPPECGVSEVNLRVLNGVPHCGSTPQYGAHVQTNELPDGISMCVNADAVLCSENRVLNCVKPPVATALFKVTQMSSLVQGLDQTTSSALFISQGQQEYLHNLMLSHLGANDTSAASSSCSVPCSEQFLASINKHLVYDDAALVSHLRASLQSSMASQSMGIRQFGKTVLTEGDLESWTSEYVPGVTTDTVADATIVSGGIAGRHSTHHHHQEEESGSHSSHAHKEPRVSRHAKGAKKREEFIGGHNMLRMDSPTTQDPHMSYSVVFPELGEDGLIGLYVKRIPKEKRLNFLTKYTRFQLEAGVIQVPGKTYTFSTYKYKYYIMVRCAASQRARRVYTNMIRGMPFSAHCKCLDVDHPSSLAVSQSSPPSAALATIGDFACSHYYRFYLKECVHMARMLAFRFASCLGVSVPLLNMVTDTINACGPPCDFATIAAPSVTYETHLHEAALHKLHKYTARKYGNTVVCSIGKRLPCSEVDSPGKLAADADTDDDALQAQAREAGGGKKAGAGESAEKKDKDEGEEEGERVGCQYCSGASKKPWKEAPDYAPSKRYWKQLTVQQDASIGPPPMCIEKSIQFENTLRLHIMSADDTTNDIAALNRGDMLIGNNFGGHHHHHKLRASARVALATHKFVQINTNTTALEFQTGRRQLGISMGSAVSSVMVRLPPLQGFAKVKLSAKIQEEFNALAPYQRIMATSALYTQEESFAVNPRYASYVSDFGLLDSPSGALSKPLFRACTTPLKSACIGMETHNECGIHFNLHAQHATSCSSSASSSSCSTSSSSSSSSSSFSDSDSDDEDVGRGVSRKESCKSRVQKLYSLGTAPLCAPVKRYHDYLNYANAHTMSGSSTMKTRQSTALVCEGPSSLPVVINPRTGAYSNCAKQRTTISDTQAVHALIGSPYQDAAFKKSLESVFLLPNDFTGPFSRIYTLHKGQPIQTINPKHWYDESARAFVKIPETIAEMLSRCICEQTNIHISMGSHVKNMVLDTEACFGVDHNDPPSDFSWNAASGNNDCSSGSNMPPVTLGDGGDGGFPYQIVSVKNRTAKISQTFSYESLLAGCGTEIRIDQYRPVCCIDSVPIGIDHTGITRRVMDSTRIYANF